MMVASLYLLSIYAIQDQHYTMHILLSVHVPGRVQSRDIIIVSSPFKTAHFQIFSKIIMTKLLGAFLQNLHG